ncbi:MerR family transcriptional regulator [Breznakia pachnodae]|uniref:DNA-binding transcriptional MerR regulator n=1 Tax=Breznakia pachnodae TaxID=265178 RepID=A0ABU0E5H6_9FIRM|nr:MerR family transcriptional regulator [Breznakia pachnodae]MDQ0362125.1 DNA-binding transcriptional MerR regulator [Breznakia pachnodae]
MNYTIKEIASKSNVTIRTLQYYDAIDLLTPAYKKDKQRFYTDNELILINCIKHYKQMGFALEDIKSIMKSKDAKKELLNIVDSNIDKLNEKADDYLNKVNMINQILSSQSLDQIQSNLLKIKVEEDTLKEPSFFTKPFHVWLKYFLIIFNSIIYLGIIALIINLLQK